METVPIVLGVGVLLGAATTPAQADEVDWNKGSGPAQMAKGLPNPPGWYEAAVGPRTPDKVLYLTSDDGPTALTPQLLDALDRYDAKATFFVLGGAAQANPRIIKRMNASGHAIGNHTWNHPRLTQIPTAAVRSELIRTKRAVGPSLDPCMRPPYGMVNQRVARASIAAGFQPVLWTAHIEDWAPHSFSWTVERLKAATKPGAVILMHDTHAQSIAAVRKMLPRWSRMGYRLQTIPACRG